MIKYRNGKIKSRPNGRRWCKLCLSNYRKEYNGGKNYIRIIYKRNEDHISAISASSSIFLSLPLLSLAGLIN
jgi:hypothetical protein